MTADDWATEALIVLGERGLAGIAVEPIAARLGTTKGSFYWHFANRDALVEAALARWEQVTEDIITTMDAEPDPRLRLRRLFHHVVTGATRYGVEVTLLGNSDDPRVAPVLRRVTARRLEYVTDVFAAIGFDDRAARQHAVLAYTAYLGHVQLAHTAPDELAGPTADQEYFDLVVDALLR
ncbi:TetR/AcrR family transcriptional regulator [Cryptosporangium aurantiacum]|uniref:TetR/AcrR family transcriptional regulator n=1 Tax=Cryptosporangium aurantiacum TaxID=134849 RepID=UPI001C4A45A4|nr:TetR/AcrR family transcriptional regulator [Cryptosporangium aurantiacum]